MSPIRYSLDIDEIFVNFSLGKDDLKIIFGLISEEKSEEKQSE